ncbi:MAG: TlpA family protein disulfide reductase [Gracilibacteraceae bacterium]|nr:TlpA family protein disulfide reductase [Gracilibacteraceae bacterium]
MKHIFSQPIKLKKVIIILLVCPLVLLTAAACGKSGAGSANSAAAAETAGEAWSDSGATVWELGIDTVTLDGEPITHEAFAENDLTVLNIWATWCPPCVRELPHLQEVSARFKDRGVQIVGVLQDGVTAAGAPAGDVIESAKTLLQTTGAAYTMILPDETITLNLIAKMQYFPTTFFINAKGEVVETVIGANDADSWEETINAVLADISQ